MSFLTSSAKAPIGGWSTRGSLPILATAADSLYAEGRPRRGRMPLRTQTARTRASGLSGRGPILNKRGSRSSSAPTAELKLFSRTAGGTRGVASLADLEASLRAKQDPLRSEGMFSGELHFKPRGISS